MKNHQQVLLNRYRIKKLKTILKWALLIFKIVELILVSERLPRTGEGRRAQLTDNWPSFESGA